MKRTASAEWKGGLKDGKGTISTGSNLLSNAQYSFGTRFEQGVGTNPEELIAAAHAGCFSMALSAQLTSAGLNPGEHQDRSRGDTGEGRRWLRHYDRASRREGQGARRRSGRLRNGREERQGRLPGLQGAQRENHDGCQARRLTAIMPTARWGSSNAVQEQIMTKKAIEAAPLRAVGPYSLAIDTGSVRLLLRSGSISMARQASWSKATSARKPANVWKI